MPGKIIMDSESPPALDQSWRKTPANKSMGVLIDRLAQKCFTDLNETVTKMAELPPPSSMNGISPPQITDPSPESVARKRMWMEFAQNQRDRFIKTLVLADWCRNEHDMAKLVDLRVWQDKQQNAQSSAISFIGTVKHNLMTAKMPNPNIEGALEVLGTSKLSHIPDLGYIPKKRMSARQLLRTLQDMNVLLATRLNLHEELPAHFNQYAIADGRATFKAPTEFEVDLSVADEDPASPFYFIDFRFTFTPSSPILHEQLRAAIEVRCNAALAANGLQGCYGFLHNLVLTHKMNVLRSQAGELIHDKWFDSLRLDTRRRVFNLQYWASRPGPKSWLEFGIATGKQKGVHSRKPPTSCLVVRWFREKEEVKDDLIELDWQNINLEKILSVVTAKHASWSLNKLRDSLVTMAASRPTLQTGLATSDKTPYNCSLELKLRMMRAPLTVRHEPLTGKISLSPPTPLTSKIESRLNRDFKLDRPGTIATLMCSLVHEQIAKMAEFSGWFSGVALARQDNLAELFGKDVLIRIIYNCNERWGPDWALVVTFSLSGENWWVVRLKDKPPIHGAYARFTSAAASGRIIATARQIALSDSLARQDLMSQGYLLRIERMAEAEVSFSRLSAELADCNVQHRFERLASLKDESPAAVLGSSFPVAMYINSTALLRNPRRKGKSIWATDFVRITHQGIETADDESCELRHDIRLTIKKGQLDHLEGHLSKGRHTDIAVASDGALALQMRVPFGQPFAGQLRDRLRHMERLNQYLKDLKMHQYPSCTSVSLARLGFTYSQSPALSVQVFFTKDSRHPMRLKFEPLGNNPHQRVRKLLEDYINKHEDDFFPTLTRTLDLTLPLFQSFERLEAKEAPKSSVLVTVRLATWYNVTYKAPLPPCSWEIRVRTRMTSGRAVIYWHIHRSDSPGSPTLPDPITLALTDMYKREGTDWWGIGDGMMAQISAIGAVLDQIDGTLRKFEGVVINTPPEELDSKPLIQQASVKPAQPQPQQISRLQQAKPQPQPMKRRASQQPPPQQMPPQMPPQMQRQLSQQAAPQMQRQPSQQAAPQMQRQPSLQQPAPQMQRQPSQQQAQQMQRQLSHQHQVQMQRQLSQQQQQQQQGQRPMTNMQRQQLLHQQQQHQMAQMQKSRAVPPNPAYPQQNHQNRPPAAPAPNTRSDPIEID